jgi:sulfite exporter TauE/SafE
VTAQGLALWGTGFLGSLHCAGMCGGFVLALGRPGRPLRARLAAPVAFFLGKASTYVLLGALAGLFGAALVRWPGFPAAQGVLAVVAGLLMVLAGLQVAGLVRELPTGSWFGPRSPYGRAVEAVSHAPGLAAPFFLGSLTGLLPCPLVYAFLAAALSAGGVLAAAGTMAVLGATSVPALAAVGVLGAVASPLARRRIVRVAGVAVVGLGVVTVLRGVAPDLLHGVFGHGTAVAGPA